MINQDVLTIILAGGKGRRLDPLTRDRTKPAVPFGGLYRIIDFTLSNCINSDLRRILVATQYKARSLNRHINDGWGFLSRQVGEYIEVLPPQQRLSESWYRGTADAVYQNIYSIEKINPRYVLILAGDHIYKMDYGSMVNSHIESNADLTIGCINVPLKDACNFGVVSVEKDGRITAFTEKPENPPPLHNDPDSCMVSMGIYVFTAKIMYDLLNQDAGRDDSMHDFGDNLIQNILSTNRVYAYHFRDRNRKAVPYWRDVGTLDAYYQASMDLVSVDPVLNLYDREWPIRTWQPQLPPPKFVFHDNLQGDHSRRGEAHDSIVCQGSIISGGHVRRSIISPNVRVSSYSTVEESIVFDSVTIGRHCRIRNAIIDKNVVIPAGTTIGYDREEDLRRGYILSDQGIVVIPRNQSSDFHGSPGR